MNFAPKHLSGIDVIDNAWGGLYRGGSYLVYGRAASGRGLLTLMFARTGASLGEPTLFISPDRQKDLMIQAASIGFNLREAYDSGIVRLVRVPPLMNLQNMGDDGVSRALWDLVTLIRQHRPTRLIMNDFMPFVAFRSYDRFRSEFIQFLEQIDSLDTTTVLVMPEPANQQSARVIEFMASQMTGSIRIELGEDSPSTTKRRISLIPHIGHIKRQVVDYWDLEDLVVPSQAPAAPEHPVQPQPSKPAEDEGFIFTPSSMQAPQAGFNVGFTPSGPSSQQVPAPQQTPAPQPAQPEQLSSMQQTFDQPVQSVQPVQPAAPHQSAFPTPPPSFESSPPPPATFAPSPAPASQPATPPVQAPPPPATFAPSPAPISQPVTPPMQAPSTVPPQPASPFHEDTTAPHPKSGTDMPDVPASTHDESDFSDRGAFQQKLEQAFSHRDSLKKPFLLLALRMDRSSQQARPFDFDFLMDLVRAELTPADDMLATSENERMVVLLGDSRAEEAQSFFARLKDRLRVESPQQADHLLHAVSAIVVPDGRPFNSASEFLTYALDEV